MIQNLATQEQITQLNSDLAKLIGFPNYSSLTNITSYGSSSNKYTCKSDGYIVLVRITVPTNASFAYYVNNKKVCQIDATSSSEGKSGGHIFPVKSGDIVYGDNYTNAYSEFYFAPIR